MSERRIKEWSEQVKDEIQQLPSISQVETFGARDYEIAIEVSEERLRQYGLSFTDVADAVRRSSLNLAGGTIRTRKKRSGCEPWAGNTPAGNWPRSWCWPGRKVR
jgi:multidrug efflux pump subunit AcrB